MLDYLNIKEYPKDKGILLDSCNKEDRLYHNGCYYDLCGMSVQDYIDSTLLNCTGNGGGGNDDPSTPGNGKTKNIVKISFIENDGGYEMIVNPQYAPAADVIMMFEIDGAMYSALIVNGNSNTIYTGFIFEEMPNKVDNITFDTTDDAFEYEGKVEIITMYNIYYGTYNFNKVNELTEENITNSFTSIRLSNGETDVMTFEVPTIIDETLADYTMEELDTFRIENGKEFVVVIEKIAYDNKYYAITSNMGGMQINETEIFVFNKNLTFNGKEYAVLSNCAPNVNFDSNPECVFPEDAIYMKKNIEIKN